MASASLLLHLLLLVPSVSAWKHYYDYYGGSVTFTPKGRNSDGTYAVELRNKQTNYYCTQNDFSCYRGNCGTQTESAITTISQNSYGYYWCHREVVMKRKIYGNQPFEIRYPTSVGWYYGQGYWISNTKSSRAGWSMQVHIDLGTRSDTGESNRSPTTTSTPPLRITQNCPRKYSLPVFDHDGDQTRCRFGTAIASECSLCYQPEGFSLDQNSCTLSYTYTRIHGSNAFELIVEDFPKKHISVSYSDGSYTFRSPLVGGRHRRAITTNATLLFLSLSSHPTVTTTTTTTTTAAPTTITTTPTAAPTTTTTTPTSATTTTTTTTPTAAPATTTTTPTSATTTTTTTPTAAPTTTITPTPTSATTTTTTTPTAAPPTTTTTPTSATTTTTTTPTAVPATTTTTPTAAPATTTTTPTAVPATTTTTPTAVPATTTTTPTTAPMTTTTTPTAAPATTTTTPTATAATTETAATTAAAITTTPTTTPTAAPTTATTPTAAPTTTTTTPTAATTTTTTPTASAAATSETATTTAATTTTGTSTPKTTTAAGTTTPTPTGAPTTTITLTTTAAPTTENTTTIFTTATDETTTNAQTTSATTTNTTELTTASITFTATPATTATTINAKTTTGPSSAATTTAAPTATATTTTRVTTTTTPTTTSTTTTTTTSTTTTSTLRPITGHYHSSSPPLSKLPLQFSIYVDPHHAASCLEGDYFPIFLPPTPRNGVNLPAFVNHTLEIRVRATAKYTSIYDLIISGPAGTTKHRTSTEEYTIKWTATDNEVNDHFAFCFYFEARDGHYRVYHSNLRCVFADVGHHDTVVHCSATTMKVEVEKSYLIQRNEKNLHLKGFSDAACSLKKYSNRTHLVAIMSLNKCGTTLEEDGDNLVFKNEITSADPNEVISRQHDVEIVFSCVYPKQTNLTLGFKHKNPYAFTEKGFSTFTFQFEFFESPRFRKQIDANTYPVEVNLKQMIFMQIEATTSVPNAELFVESCRATPYDNPNSRISYTIIEHGCVKDNTVEIYEGSKAQFRFGMEAFEFIGAYAEVYITCSVILCEIGIPGTRCSQGCIKSNSGSHRSKREAAAQTSSHSISQGPLHLIKTSDSQVSGLSLTQGMNLMLIATLLLACGGLVYHSRRSKATYQLLPNAETD